MRSNERHPGSERRLRRVCPPLRYVSSGAQGRAKSREFAEFQDCTLRTYRFCRNFVCWPPRSGAVICRKLASGTKKSLLGTPDFAHFLHWRCGLRIAKKIKAKTWTVNEGPSADKAWVGIRTRGNSGLCRLCITHSVGERKIDKISVVGNIGSDAKT